MIFDKHSDLIESTNRSAYAFRFGDFAGNVTTFTPSSSNRPFTSFEKTGSRSKIRYLAFPQEAIDGVGQVEDPIALVTDEQLPTRSMRTAAV